MHTRNHTRTDLAYGLAMALTVIGLVFMGFDNGRQLERCQSSGRGQAECRLLVLGR